MSKQEYYCPACGHKMEAIFCECSVVLGKDLTVQEDGKFYHSCGKPLPPKTAEFFKVVGFGIKGYLVNGRKQ